MHTVAQHLESSEPDVHATFLPLKAPRDIESKRIMKHEQASANRWYLYVRLEHPRDVDSTLVGWIEQAYGLAE
jgi:hypothetical protein